MGRRTSSSAGTRGGEATDWGAGVGGASGMRSPAHPARSSYFWMIWGRPAGGGGGGGIPRGPGAGGAGAPGTLRASLSGCSEPLASASWLMAAAGPPAEARSCPGSRARRTHARGRPRDTGAHWPGSPCPVPLSFPVARGGDAGGGEEAVPAAPPPPPPAAPAGPDKATRSWGQGASPGQPEPLGGPGAPWSPGGPGSSARRTPARRAPPATGRPRGPGPGREFRALPGAGCPAARRRGRRRRARRSCQAPRTGRARHRREALSAWHLPRLAPGQRRPG